MPEHDGVDAKAEVTITSAMQEAFDQLVVAHKKAKITAFHANGRFLSAEQITAILNAIKIQQASSASTHIDNNIRYSKLYLKNELKIHIDRGGVICMKDPNNQLTLFALYKGFILGKGGFSKIKIMQNQTTGELEALKVFKITCKDLNEKAKNLHMVEQEAKCLAHRGLGSEYIIKKIRSAAEEKENENPLALKFYIRMKYIKGYTLLMFLKQGNLPRDFRYEIMFKLLLDLKQIHQDGILHRDIKPGNIIVDQHKKTVKIIDYGFARFIADIKPTGRIDRIEGTPGYLAPELMSGRLEAFSEASDIYALAPLMQDLFGIVAQVKVKDEMVTFGKTDPSVHSKFTDYERSLLTILINQIQDRDPKKRPSINAILYQLTNIAEHVNSPDVFKTEFKTFQSMIILLNKIKRINEIKLIPHISDHDIELNDTLRDSQFLKKRPKDLTLKEEYQIAIIDRYLISRNSTKIEKMQREVDAAATMLVTKFPTNTLINDFETFLIFFPKMEKDKQVQEFKAYQPLAINAIDAYLNDKIDNDHHPFLLTLNALPSELKGPFVMAQGDDRLKRIIKNKSVCDKLLHIVSEDKAKLMIMKLESAVRSSPPGSLSIVPESKNYNLLLFTNSLDNEDATEQKEIFKSLSLTSQQ